MQSDNQLHTLIMQPDGNVVLYNQQNQPLWSTNTYGIQPRDFQMQGDGNLVLYDTSGAAKWNSGTAGNPGAFLNVQDDGDAVVYRAGSQTETANNALWASGSYDAPTSGEQVVQQGGQGGSNPQAQEMLSAQNRYRAEVGVAPLQWSDTLAASAQQWADHLAATGTLEHSSSGENLAQAGSSDAPSSVTQLVDIWGAEKQYFVNGSSPNLSSTGNFGDVGHYTQMIWRNTTEVGCGIAYYDSAPYHMAVLVCHYNPAGNVDGQSVL